MVAVFATLLFTAALTASIWAMFVTIAPRIDYMRTLLRGDVMPELAPVQAARVRATPRGAPRRTSAPLRAAA